MIKKIGFFAVALMGLTVSFIPAEAHAVKLKIQPSITFRNSYTHFQPRQRVYVQRPPQVYHYYNYYTPYYDEVVMVEQPYYYDTYPSYVHSHGTDFQLKFKIK